MHKSFKVKPTEELLLALEQIVQNQVDMIEFKKIAVKVATDFLRENNLTHDQCQTMISHVERLVISTTMDELCSNFEMAEKDSESIIGYSHLS